VIGVRAWSRAIAGLSLVVLAGPAVAAPAWYETWEGIRAAAATAKTIETSFVQTRSLKILSKPLVSRGMMAYRRPNDLRWEYQSPIETVLIVRAGQVSRFIRHGAAWVPDASARLEAMKIVLGEISLWLDGNFSASRTFRPQLRPAQGGQRAYIELLPVDPALGKIIARITMTFADKPGVLDAIDIVEDKDNVTHIAFENQRLGGTIPDARFEPPR